MAGLLIGAGISGGKAFQAGMTGDVLNALIAHYMRLIGIVNNGARSSRRSTWHADPGPLEYSLTRQYRYLDHNEKSSNL